MNLQQEVTKVLSHVKIRQDDEADAIERQREQERVRERVSYQHQAVSALSRAESAESPPAAEAAQRQQPLRREAPKIGRNAPCPCGSGKKYKTCHGRL